MLPSSGAPLLRSPVDGWVTMSAIGKCVRMKRADLARALGRAKAIHTETSGRGLWKKKVKVRVDEFERVATDV